jgi:hypothetical protein
MQADGAYNLEKNNNRGDAGDTYKRGGVGNITVLSSTTTPSTQSYQGNVLPLRDTGITITVLSASNYTMAFRVCALFASSFDMCTSLAVEYDVFVYVILLSWPRRVMLAPMLCSAG